MRRRLTRVRFATTILVFASLALPAVSKPAESAPANRNLLRPYEGLGAWVDIYDPLLWRHPVDVVRDLKAHGVQTLFLETSSWRVPDPIFKPSVTATFITESHRLGIQVVAWYVPDFYDAERDFRRSMAAIRFRTPNGQKFDSFALDIESFRVPDPAKRSTRLVQLSARLRNAVGNRYSLGAIVISPVATHRIPSGWPGFPYRALADYYDVFLPMGYYTFRTDGSAAAFNYTRDTLQLLREDTGRAKLPIHAIGGLAESTDGPEAAAFVDAVKRFDAIGASLYDFDTTGPEDWAHIEKVRVDRTKRASNSQSRPNQARDLAPATAPPKLFLRVLLVYSWTNVEMWSIPSSGGHK